MIDPAEIVDQLEERGFCVIESLLSAETTDALRSLLDDIRQEEITPKIEAARHHRVLHLAAKHPLFLEPVTNETLLAVGRRFLGDDVVCSTWSSNTLMPGFEEVYWHVDHPYWTIAPPYPVSIPLTAQAIWFLDDFTDENGATAFLPKSHRIPHVPDLGGAWPAEAVMATGPRGSLLLAHGACWHTPTPNRTDRPRSALLARYARSFCVTQEDMRWQLDLIDAPSELIKHLFCSNQYRPQRGFPY